jgi:TrmH family RNA methyltransferase
LKLLSQMPVRIVHSKQNGRLKELRRALAQSPREENGLAGIEGPNLLLEAVRAQVRFKCVFAALGSERMVDGLGLASETEVLLMPRELLTSALATETPQPIAALIETPDWIWRDLLHGEREDLAKQMPLFVVLAGLQDPGNLGTILRSAEAFGASGVISLPGTVSAWNQKAVRASAGSVFRVPVLPTTAEECFARLRESGVKILSTASRGTAAHEVDLAGPVALLIGNEGNGVPAELASTSDGVVAVPCPGPVESLNASVAAGVLLYEVSRQRGKKQ